MQAILTKYIGPSNSRGSRIKATCEAMALFVPYDHALNIEENHTAACDELCRRMDRRNKEKYGADCRDTWQEPKIMGQLPDRTYAHVFAPSRATV